MNYKNKNIIYLITNTHKEHLGEKPFKYISNPRLIDTTQFNGL